MAEPPAPTQPDDEELAKRLIRQAGGQEDGGIMSQVLGLMQQVAQRLSRGFDPGPATQEAQKEIIKKLDEAIAAARRQGRQSGGQSGESSDRREAQARPDQSSADSAKDKSGQTGAEAGTRPGEAKEGEAREARPSERFREFRRGWGNLPARDREEVLQGVDEDVIEKYRSIIEGYFRTLAEDKPE